MATGLRYYVDRRVSDLASAVRVMEEQQRDARQAEREAELRGQLHVTELKLQDSTKKVTALEEQARPRALTVRQRDQLVVFLRDKPKGRVVIKASATAPDARAYAEEFRDVLAQDDCSSHCSLELLYPGVGLVYCQLVHQSTSVGADRAGLLAPWRDWPCPLVALA
ncbi:MAG: hypothetical protein ABL983_14155, partial [Nitrospira sp.]